MNKIEEIVRYRNGYGPYPLEEIFNARQSLIRDFRLRYDCEIERNLQNPRESRYQSDDITGEDFFSFSENTSERRQSYRRQRYFSTSKSLKEFDTENVTSDSVDTCISSKGKVQGSEEENHQNNRADTVVFTQNRCGRNAKTNYNINNSRISSPQKRKNGLCSNELAKKNKKLKKGDEGKGVKNQTPVKVGDHVQAFGSSSDKNISCTTTTQPQNLNKERRFFQRCDLCEFQCASKASEESFKSNHFMKNHLKDKGHYSASLLEVNEKGEFCILKESVFIENDAKLKNIVPICPVCFRISITIGLVATHYEYKHDKNVHNQYGVGKVSLDEQFIIPIGKYSCIHCPEGRPFKKQKELIQHWKQDPTHRPFPQPDSDSVVTFLCTYCKDIEPYYKWNDFLTHMFLKHHCHADNNKLYCRAIYVQKSSIEKRVLLPKSASLAAAEKTKNAKHSKVKHYSAPKQKVKTLKAVVKAMKKRIQIKHAINRASTAAKAKASK